MKVDSTYLNNNSEVNNIKQSENSVNKFKHKLQKAYNAHDKERLKKLCSQFEAIFVNMMLNQMHSTIMKSELLPKSMARDVFEGMYYEKIADKVSETNNIGISDMLYRQLASQIDSKKSSFDKEG